MRHASQKTRAGFTLVELLVVIAIIGVLMALGTGASIMALNTVRRKAIKIECEGFEQALMMYESEYGELPPDFSDDAAVNRHLYTRFDGKYTGGAAGMQVDILDHYEIDIAAFSPADALVFWLGGLPATAPDPGEPYVPAGFNSNDRAPFTTGGPRTGATYSGFDPERIAWSVYDEAGVATPSGHLYYMNSAPLSTPYVYFKSRMIGVGTADAGKGYDPSVQRWMSTDIDGTDLGMVVPYMRSSTVWFNNDGVQVITAGLDGEFSTSPEALRIVQDATGFSIEDEDNISNFSNATTIGGDTE